MASTMAYASFSIDEWRLSESDSVLEKNATGLSDCVRVAAIVVSEASVSMQNGMSFSISICAREESTTAILRSEKAASASSDKGKEVVTRGLIRFENCGMNLE